jgi:HD superfamily phosphodiesterase
MSPGFTTWSHAVAAAELGYSLPRRWAHSQGVARRAAELAKVMGKDADLLESAAVLHDVGYARASP